MYKPFTPEKIWIEKRVLRNETTREILSRLPEVPVKEIGTINEVLAREINASGEKILILAKQEGEFLKPCPGTRNYICCNYFFLNLATNCDINCSYCILQSYLNNPYMTVYTNLDEMYPELDKLLKKNANRFYRIGTGELTDSLTLDHLTRYSKKLIPFFLKHNNAILELKTKTTQIDNLLDFSPQNRVIVSWSLNPQEVIDREEKKSPSLRQRLAAAKQCGEAGYLLGFHFDPLIHYAGWENGYRDVVRRIFAAVPADRIVWISLGALRYSADMDRIVRKRHPESTIVLGEMFSGKDGKLRYFRPIRERMFQRMVQWIRQEDNQVRVYLCMESPEVWRKAFGEQPLVQCGLPQQLDQAVFQRRDGAEPVC
ncbi:MAG TPA: hypothetical protein ENH29_00895 [Bacteroidetes bacterium]|nr:hypothetical protein [Bacteroidota bacterium]